jgi:cytosine/adenosine deaminase-related metal-dependent hydrolase
VSDPDSTETTLLTAAWVAPMSAPIIRDGGVVHAAGRIIAVGDAKQLATDFPHATVEDLGDVTLLPGLVNAHTHLELSDCACGPPPLGGFADWLGSMLSRTRLPPNELEQNVRRAVPIGVEQSLRFGVTTVGDISRQVHVTRPLLRASPLRVISYGEIQAMAQRRNLLDERLESALDTTHATERLRIGLSPHAPYSVEPQGYSRCLRLARDRALPLATHLAETPFEAPFLRDHTGLLRTEVWDKWLTWDEQVPTFGGGPIRFAQQLDLLDYPTLLAHVNYVADDELEILSRGRASVVYCPRTHAFFDHPPHRWRDMLSRGINVALGTDSCASSPDLNVVDDLRLVHRIAPEVAPYDLWQLVTTRAAKAVMQTHIGRLATRAAADFVAFETSGDDPLRGILESERLPSRVWIDGVPNPMAGQE